MRTNNQEITAVGLQPSAEFQTLLPGAGEQQLLVVPCPAIDSAITLASHAKSFHEAALTSSAQSAAPFQAVVASDVDTAQAGAAASVLGLALLIHSIDSGQVAELVFKAGSRSQEDAKLTACHLQVRPTMRLHHIKQACPGAIHVRTFLYVSVFCCVLPGMQVTPAVLKIILHQLVPRYMLSMFKLWLARTAAGVPV